MRITKSLIAGFLVIASVAVVGVAPAGAPPIVTGTLAPTTEGGVVVASWTSDTPAITVYSVLLEAPAECPSLIELFDGWDTGYQTIPVNNETDGMLTIESGLTVFDLSAGGSVPLPTDLYQICLYWTSLEIEAGNQLASLDAEIGVPEPEPTTTTTAAPTTTTTTAPAAPATPRYMG